MCPDHAMICWPYEGGGASVQLTVKPTVKLTANLPVNLTEKLLLKLAKKVTVNLAEKEYLAEDTQRITHILNIVDTMYDLYLKISYQKISNH